MTRHAGLLLVGIVFVSFVALTHGEQQGKEKGKTKSSHRDSNRSLLTQLNQAEATSASKTGPNNTGHVLLARMPKFKSLTSELKWKFNKARKDLQTAKQYVALAEKTAGENHRGTQDEQAVKDIITQTEVVLVHAGEKMGLDYVHFKRSIEDEEDYK